MKIKNQYYGGISTLLNALKTVSPLSNDFHIHRFEDTPITWVKQTSIFRSNTYSIILLTKGKAFYKIGLSEYNIEGPSLYFQSPKQLRHYNRLTDWEGYVIVFTDDFVTDDNYLAKLVQG